MTGLAPADLDALAHVVHLIRPDWPIAGIRSHLGNLPADLPPGQAVTRAISAAVNGTNRLPVTLTWDRHAPTTRTVMDLAAAARETARVDAIASCGLCDEHGETTTGTTCRHEPDPGARRRGEALAHDLEAAP